MPGMLQQAQEAAARARQVPVDPSTMRQQPTPGSQQPGPQPTPGSQQPGPQPAPGPQQPGPAQPTDVAASDMPPDEVVEQDVSAHTSDVDPVRGDVNIKTKMNEANEDEQQEYKKAFAALSQVLYSNEKSSSTIVKALESTQQDKIDPVAKMGVLVIQQLDEKIDLDEAVVAQITQDATERLIEMAETRYGVEYDEVEYQQALGTTWEGVMAAFGVEEDDYKRFTESVHPEDMVVAKRAYQGAIAHG